MATAPCFHVKEGDSAGTVIQLTHFPFSIGRARECDFVIDSTDVSRLHAQFELDHQQIYIKDTGSTNGTLLNNRPLEPNKMTRVRAGDTIHIGNVATLLFDDPATTAQIPELGVAGLRIDDQTADVYVKGERLDPPLSPSQFNLLSLLMHNEDAVVTREDVKVEIWGDGVEVTDQTIDALVSRLRKRLFEADADHEYVVTRRGFGLMFRNRFME